MDPGTVGMLGLAIGLFGMLQSGFFTYGTINGLDSNLMPVRPGLGKPWSVWIQCGLDGSTNRTLPDDDPLQGAGGPFPNVYLFNDIGEYLGKPYSMNDYVQDNTVRKVHVFPNNIRTDEGQDATIAILSARDVKRDGMLITEVAFGLENNNHFSAGPYGITADTMIACGVAWYPSGVYGRRTAGGFETLRGFWLGGEHGIGAMQIHGPSFDPDKTEIDYEKYGPGKNGDQEDLIRDFCLYPARLGLRMKPVFTEEEARKIVWTDTTTIKDPSTMVGPSMRYSGHPESHNGESSSGMFARSLGSEQDPTSSQEESIRSSKRKLLTVAEKEIDISAKQVCQSPTAVGPDYVNTYEGMFCRMEDRKVFPVCNPHSRLDENTRGTETQEEQCFDMETKQIGWLPSDGDFTLEHPGRFRSRATRRRLAQRNQAMYDGELRTGGDGWKLNHYS